MDKDYYKILGVDKQASKEDVKKAFHKLAHKYHPDKHGGDAAKFKEISEAYSVLGDDKKRGEYDSYGRVFSGGDGGGFDFSSFAGDFGDFGVDLGDIFGNVFGGGFGGSRTPRGRDISIDIQISFREAVFGVRRNVVLAKQAVCDTCGGSGARPGTPLKTCPRCGGSGKVRDTKTSLLGTFTMMSPCSVCRAVGKVPQEKCPTCRGDGIFRRQESIDIVIPPGIENGEMIRLSGGGEAVKGGVAGDLYIKVHVAQDPLFKKEGANLMRDLSIKLSDALLGTEYKVKTLEGDISVTIPTGVSHGEVIRLKGKGVPVARGKRGDLLIRIIISLPQKLSKNAKGLIEKLKEEGI